jgi:hypothetical protein
MAIRTKGDEMNREATASPEQIEMVMVQLFGEPRWISGIFVAMDEMLDESY